MAQMPAAVVIWIALISRRADVLRVDLLRIAFLRQPAFHQPDTVTKISTTS